MGERPYEYRTEPNGGWIWSEEAADFVQWEGIRIRWRFKGERKWRKTNVIPQGEQTRESLLRDAEKMVFALASKVDREAAGDP